MTSQAFVKIASAIALTGTLAFGAGVVAAERFPELDRAEHALHDARDALQHAARDFGGHRVEALKHVDAALGEIREAKHWAETH